METDSTLGMWESPRTESHQRRRTRRGRPTPSRDQRAREFLCAQVTMKRHNPAESEQLPAQLPTHREVKEKTVNKIQAALSYPALVLCVATSVVAVLVLYVVPIFAGMYANFNADLPSLTQFVVELSAAIRAYMWWVLAALLTIVVGGLVVSLFNGTRHAVDRTLLVAPVIARLYRKVLAARLCHTLGVLLTSGVKLVDGLSIAARTTGNRFVRESMAEVHNRVVVGQTLTEALEASNLYPYAMLRLVAAGERTGELGQMILRSASYFEQESQNQIKTFSGLIEPWLLLSSVLLSRSYLSPCTCRCLNS